MQLSSPARCNATSFICWFCLQRLFCSNSLRGCASLGPPAHILPRCRACKYVLQQGVQLRQMLPRQWDLIASIATASLISVGSMECHCRHITSLGTPCSNPSSYKSFSFTGRADMFTGILRQHAGTLSVFSLSCSMLLPKVRSPRSLTMIFRVFIVK